MISNGASCLQQVFKLQLPVTPWHLHSLFRLNRTTYYKRKAAIINLLNLFQRQAIKGARLSWLLLLIHIHSTGLNTSRNAMATLKLKWQPTEIKKKTLEPPARYNNYWPKREIRLAGHLACLWTETDSRSTNSKKMKEANLQPSTPNKLSRIFDMAVGEIFLRN